jgi:RNA polymerase sigma-70 factor, ECF subfamily
LRAGPDWATQAVVVQNPAESQLGSLLDDDERMLAALRAGEEAAFVQLVQRFHRPLVRLAHGYVKRDDVAEEIAQEAWQGLLESLDRFEPRGATLKTWLYRILINCARSRQRKERKTTPLSALSDDNDDGPAVDPDRFQPEGHAWAGHWASVPRTFVLDDPAVSEETRLVLSAAIAALPDQQREVMTLRDVHGLASNEVCEALALTEANQRVLLHRARSRVRAYLEERLGGEQ